MASTAMFFEGAYSGADRYWWAVPHAYSTSPEDHASSLLAQETLRIATSRPPGSAIDIGSGEGADAIRLARLGWNVEALELTASGCRKIAAFAAQAGVDIRVHQCDIRQFMAEGLFDIVICNGVLHYVSEKREVCRKLQSMTAPGGANIVSLWSDYTPVPECHQIVPTFPDHEEGEVVRSYLGWKKRLLYFERNKLEASHADMAPHVHSFIKMVAVNEPCT